MATKKPQLELETQQAEIDLENVAEAEEKHRVFARVVDKSV